MIFALVKVNINQIYPSVSDYFLFELERHWDIGTKIIALPDKFVISELCELCSQGQVCVDQKCFPAHPVQIFERNATVKLRSRFLKK
jgi:hypothetical protein